MTAWPTKKTENSILEFLDASRREIGGDIFESLTFTSDQKETRHASTTTTNVNTAADQ